MPKRFLDQRWPWFTAAAVIILAFLSTIVEFRGDPDADRRRVGSAEDIERLRERTDTNVLFVLIDTLRADHLGAYGYGRETSPVLDRLSRGGVRFARQLSQSSWTKCSMASLWSGLNPARNGITRFDDVIPDQALLPAEILKEAGFRTAGIYRNGWVAPTFGFDQGFDAYARPTPRPIPQAVRLRNPTVKYRGTDEDLVATGVEFMRVQGDERWFLYLHFMDVHEYTYDEGTALFGGSYADIYDNSIRWEDRSVGLLMSHLADQGYAENTLVVIAADHGEAFRERGFEGHARRVYRETTEVPLFILFPFRLEPGVVVNTRTRNIDIWPTILDLVGLEPPPDIDGRSLVPDILAAVRGEAPPAEERIAVAHLDQNWGQRARSPSPTVAVTEGSLRYVRTDTEGADQPLEELFDAGRDPRELEDLAEQDPETLERLRTAAESYLGANSYWGDIPVREISEFELNQLRALGYAIP